MRTKEFFKDGKIFPNRYYFLHTTSIVLAGLARCVLKDLQQPYIVRSISFFFFLASFNVYGEQKAMDIEIKIDPSFQITQERLEMTKQYANHHYNINDYRVNDPQIVVIHYTVISSLESTLRYFRRDSIESQRGKLHQSSPLNVGIHYVVDKDGSIYKLLPDTIMARHLVGFNYTSIGIENVAKSVSELTLQQLESNVKLVKYLSDKYHSIKYLIGHSEYNDKSLPHYKLILLNDPSYTPHAKGDPGATFMSKLRKTLHTKYDLQLKK